MGLRLLVFADLHYGGVFKEGERCINELTEVMEREKPDACVYLVFGQQPPFRGC